MVYANGTGTTPLFLYWDAGGVRGRVSDDVGYVAKMLDDLATVVNVDPRRVFATGMSNGAMMCYRLAAELSDRIAAIAPIAGTMAIEHCQPRRPVSVLHFHGTKDGLVLFGGPDERTPKNLKFLSVDETIRAWVRANGCPEAPVVADLQDLADDGTTVRRKVFGPGKEGSEVVLYIIEGGGHTWPGQDPRLRLLGKSTRDVSANDLMWEFFRETPHEMIGNCDHEGWKRNRNRVPIWREILPQSVNTDVHRWSRISWPPKIQARAVFHRDKRAVGEKEELMAERQTLPVLPLRGTVIFPGITVPIGVGRPGTLHAIEAALKGDRLIFAVAQRENVDEPAPEQLYTMGVIGRIGQVQRGLGGVQLLLQGENRATALHYHNVDGFLTVDALPIEEMKPINEDDPAFAALYRETRERAMELGERKGLPEEVLHQVLDSVTDPGRFADLVAGYVELSVAEKQALLETLGVEERLRRVLIHVQKQIGLLAAQAEIKSQVQEELGERQREMFLREQLKAIQKELGEGDENREITELREKLNKLELPREARVEVERELGRLERAGRESMEAQVIRTYLEWVAELPWNIRSDDQLDLNHATEVLDEDHYGLQDVKDRVLEFLAVRQLRARQLAEEVEKSGECSAAKLKAEQGHRHAFAGQRAGGRPGDHRLARGQGAGHGQGADPAVRRPAGRGQDVDRQVDRPVAGAEVHPRGPGRRP